MKLIKLLFIFSIMLFVSWSTVNSQSITLTAPANGLTGVSILPNFEWTSSGVPDYKLYLSVNSNLSSPIINGEAIAASPRQLLETDQDAPNSYTGIPLSNATTYYWQVTSGDGSVQSAVYHFTTYIGFNLYLSFPFDGMKSYQEPIDFSWTTDVSITNLRFTLQIRQQDTAPTATEWADVDTDEYTNLTDLTKSLTGFIGGKKYYWRIIATTPLGDEVNFTNPYYFTTSGGAAVTIVPSFPTDGVQLFSLTPRFHWYLSELSDGFTFQVRYATSSSVDGNGELDGIDAASVPALGTTDYYYDLTTPVSAATTYYWQVIGTYDYGTGTETVYSAVESFNSPTVGFGIPVTPIPSYPVDGITVYDNNPYFYWYLTSDWTGLVFDIEIQPVADAFTGTPTVSGLTQLITQITSLTPGETYKWQIRSRNTSTLTESSWSSPETFTVTGGITNSYPILRFPIDNNTVYTRTPTLGWYLFGSSLGLQYYTIKWYKGVSASDWSTYSPVSNDADGGEHSTSDLTTLYYDVPVNLEYGAKYYWAVAAYDGSDYTAWASSSFYVTSGGPGSLTIIPAAPSGGVTLSTTSADFFWYVIGNTDGIVSYDLEYSPSDVFASSVTTSVTVAFPTTSYSASSLTPGSTYYWRVQAYDGTTYSSWSATETFIVAPGSGAVQPIVGGPDNVVVTTDSPTFSWVINTQVNAELNYELEVSDNIDFNNSLFFDGISETHLDVNGLEKGKNYFWRVRSRVINSTGNDNTFSLFSGTGSFKVADDLTSVGENIIPSEFAVHQNYPNPFNPETAISYALPENAFVTIKIYNMLGQEVKTLINREHESGFYVASWRGDDNYGSMVASGAYIYRVTAGSKVQTKKMVLLK